MVRRARAAACLIVVFALGASVVESARAGGYDVYSCAAGVAGAANHSFVPVADSGMTAYTYCPPGQGLVARNVYDNGRSPGFSSASMVFDAPAGTTVASISFEMGWRRHDCSWGIGVFASGYDFGGQLIYGWPANHLCSYASFSDDFAFLNAVWSFEVNAPRVRIEVRCGASSCPRNGVTAMRLRNVVVHVHDDAPPGLFNGRGGLWNAGGWVSGSQTIGFDAFDSAGISQASVLVDGREVAHRVNGCDQTARSPCPQASLDAAFSTAAFGDGTHTIAIAAVDSAGNPSTASHGLKVDNTAPDAPEDLALEGADGWRSTNDFDVHWTPRPPATGSPIAGVGWELCRPDGSSCVRGSAQAANISRIDNLSLPAPGEFRLRVWLVDEAGNADRRLSAGPIALRYDDASPQLAFRPPNPDDPTRVVVTTSDRGSRVTAGTVEMRRIGARAWTKLRTTLRGEDLVAHVDDERLRSGRFELRATASDAAGNERSTSRQTDGEKATVKLPLRLATHLRVGIVIRKGRHRRIARTAHVSYGRRIRVRARLTSANGNPVAGAELRVFSATRGQPATAHLLAIVKTSRTGRFSFVVRKGPSRRIRVSYAGAPLIRSATRRLSLNVRASTTLRPSASHLVNGESVRFTGKIRTGPIPGQGKLVEMQVLVRGRWRTFATTRADRAGAWSYDYRFDGTRGRQTYRFRAKVPPEEGYPFAVGRSKVVQVDVTGL